jgi:hypothetical protein
MVAKLRACEGAARAGVKQVLIVDGRDLRQLRETLAGPTAADGLIHGTRITR